MEHSEPRKMITKVISAISICWVIGVCGATRPTQLNPNSTRRNEARTGTSPLNPSNLGLGTSPQRVPLNSAAPRQPPCNAGIISSATSEQPGRTSSGLGLGSTPVSSNSGATLNPVIPAPSVSGALNIPGNTDFNATTAGGSSRTGTSVNQGGTGISPSGTSRTPANLESGAATDGVASSTGTSNRHPNETGRSGSPAPSLPTTPTTPVVAKPGSPPPPPLNKNTTGARPKSQRIESQIAGPLNDPRLVRQLPKRRNQGIRVYVHVQDIPFLIGPLNEPPLSVSVFGMRPDVPRRPPRLPAILRMPLAE
uniref:Pancreatic trypsin inhibitor n=1 Tax=Rhipicephalus appendiculatus TaxID=34631 RepID=A0A131YR93_RHIAP